MGGATLSGTAWGEVASSTLVSSVFSSPRHTTHYLESGPVDGPLIIFLHGFPSLSLIWRTQMDAFAADGWHCIAPDLRGYGGSSAPSDKDAYAMKEIVADMVELHDHLGGKPAIWVGHDWGSIVTGAVAAHEPGRTRGVVLASWAYFPDGNALNVLVPLVDRTIYPAEQFPDGQWGYARYYNTNFDGAVADLDTDREAYLASAYQPGNPTLVGKVSPMAMVTRNGGRFGAAHRAPPTQPNPDLWPLADFTTLVQAFKPHGFRGPCAWYTNDDADVAYAHESANGGRLSQPVLFINGDFDQICSITGNRQGDPMRAACADLTIASLQGGHWLPLERKAELSQTISTWLKTKNL
ncbi:alpha/beta hydrolase [Rhizobium leguminosarum]|uniref:alpha/beta fold hydrolase n=1 Tax=Rhizobium ruizarguesonis TaxID=2081791 RepID=UPI0013BB31BF|nr:alpha/beta hydrolase [Rhizobium ruizarguesonis]MBY5891664.1 alpha/beta hydrolase [Rhizobium leguminosarum]NEJ18224.1 alpha/beta fold hydrolase [Rhizobium ruizarguesonis]NEK32215.1 alpha/beta fold hydrolase [Rhizobium ruizarguesonis]QSZ05910.1 alpha/beta hydrolase [Rhizobium ruizarguesonis]